jgi:heme A synthase
VSVRTAAAVTYIRLVGASPDTRDTLRMQRTLNQLARALAALVPIHAYDVATGTMTAIDSAALQAARFHRGGDALVKADGSEQENLMVQRADLEVAIATLQQTSFPRALKAAHSRPTGD